MKALALTAALLGVLLYLQWRDWPPGPPRVGLDRAASTGSAGISATESSPFARLAPLEAKDAYASVNDRTLFRPQRKPPDPSAAGPSAAPDTAEAGSLEGLDLSAVVIAPGTTQAWVADPAQGLQRLRLGDLYQGWSVKDITPDTLVLERQGKTNTLVLRDFSQVPPPPAKAPTRQTPASQRRPQPAQGAQPPHPDRRGAPQRPHPAPQPVSP